MSAPPALHRPDGLPAWTVIKKTAPTGHPFGESQSGPPQPKVGDPPVAGVGGRRAKRGAVRSGSFSAGQALESSSSSCLRETQRRAARWTVLVELLRNKPWSRMVLTVLTKNWIFLLETARCHCHHIKTCLRNICFALAVAVSSTLPSR